MTGYDLEVQNLIGNLDEVCLRYEAKWGIDRLPELVDEAMRQKWLRQYDRLCEAISNNDLALLRDLVPGTVRGYAALEAAALALGCVPHDPVFWEVQLPETNRRVRIVQNNHDAARVIKEGVEVWTLQEVARVMDERLRTLSQVKATWPEAEVTAVKKGPFDFSRGDSLEF